jgi:HAD superfamily hydrolase (TIGR01662 family)
VNDPPVCDLVIPTIGRPSLAALLQRVDSCTGRRPGRVIVVDDRRHRPEPLTLPALSTLSPIVVASAGRGPAAARNAGWRRCSAPWCVFVDDDVLPELDWLERLHADLAAASPLTGAVQGRLTVPRPAGRAATDAERQVINLEQAPWITADMAIRRRALVAVGGFDERFRRAYREDTELGLRLTASGWEIAHGQRRATHPLRAGTWRSSVVAQRGNADDALVRRLHGRQWRAHGHAPHGELRRHVATSMCWTIAVMAVLGRRRQAGCIAAAAATALTVSFWWRRVSRGPFQLAEAARMAASSALIPPLATWWAGWGHVRARRLAPGRSADRWAARSPRLVLFDRDGTLVDDVPYNGDPARVAVVEGARETLDRLRRAGVRVGIATNQSGIAQGLIDQNQVDAVHDRVRELLGDFDVVEVCPHSAAEGCGCRKPLPGMVLAAAAQLDVEPHECAVIGDIGSDIEAALAAGARAVLVPTPTTLAHEVASAPEVVPNLIAAAELLLTPGGQVRR